MASFASGLMSGFAGTAMKKRDKDAPKKQMKAADKAIKSDVGNSPVPADILRASPGQYRRGGKVKKSGWAKVHKNERVLTPKQQRRMKRRRGQSAKR